MAGRPCRSSGRLPAREQLNNDMKLVSVRTSWESIYTKVRFMQKLNLKKPNHLSVLTYWVIRKKFQDELHQVYSRDSFP